MGGLWAYVSNRLVFWLDDTLSRYWVLSPVITVVGTAGLLLGALMDKLNFHPEDTQNNFAVAEKPAT